MGCRREATHTGPSEGSGQRHRGCLPPGSGPFSFAACPPHAGRPVSGRATSRHAGASRSRAGGYELLCVHLPPSHRAAPPASILLVDDHPASLLALEAVLEPLGQRLVRAQSGREALAALLHEDFACVLLDVQMPELDGFETARLIRERPRTRSLPLLFLTGVHREEAAVLRGYAHGAVDYILKPFNPDILRTKVAVFVDLFQQQRALREEARVRADLEREVMEREREARFAPALDSALDGLRRDLAPLTLVDAMVAAAPVGLAVIDPALRYLRANEALARLHGVPMQALPGHTVQEVAPDVAERVAERVREVLRTGQPALGLPFVRERVPGERRHLLASYYPLTLPDATRAPGAAVAVGVVAMDVTALKEAEEAQRASEERLRVVLAALTEGVVVQDAAGVLRMANASAQRLFGEPAARLAGRTSYDAEWGAVDEEGRPLPGALHPPMVALRTGQPVLGRVMGVRGAEGRTVWLSVNAQPLFAEDGRTPTGVVSSFVDVTETRALAEERAQLLREAQAAVRLRDEFLSVASHELKTPLTPLHLKLAGLQRQAQAGGLLEAGRVQADLAVAQRQVRRLASLVDDLLDVSRLTQGRLTLSPEPVELGALVRDVVGGLEAEAAWSGCSVALEVEEPVEGAWDPVRLEQVASNLLTNALKYGAGRPVQVRVGRREGRALLSVRDHGIGIEEEALPRLFGKFVRAVSERHYGGLGLGLFITRQIVEAHGGSVSVQSRPHEGALFEVLLPLAAGGTP
nr:MULTISPECIES: ATP-binding protein [Myxococcaceae]